MKRSSFFKIIFWILTVIVGALLAGGVALVSMGSSIDPDFPPFMFFFFIPMMVFIAAVITVLSVFTYKDASKRNMDQWMWMTIVVFVPNFIGLIIYLIVRKNNIYEKRCFNCKKPVSSDFTICPYCGASLNDHCPGCAREVSSEWSICPFCSQKLK